MSIETGTNGACIRSKTEPRDINGQIDDLSQLMRDVAKAGQGGRSFIENCVGHMIATVITNIPEGERRTFEEIQERRDAQVAATREGVLNW